LAFFGLNPNYRQHVHSHIFDLIYHGNGGFTFSDVYNLPVWARKFYIGKILDFKTAENKANETHAQKLKQKGKR